MLTFKAQIKKASAVRAKTGRFGCWYSKIKKKRQRKGTHYTYRKGL